MPDMTMHQPSSERGATLVMVTVTMLALMAFAALAVDAAAAWSQRRENQGAVDVAAIAGAQFTVGVDEATGRGDAQDEVIRTTYVSIAPAMTAIEWEAAWLACVDAAKPAEYTLTHTSDCISFNAAMTQMRVRLPDVAVPTSFAWIVGADTISTAAAAEVEIGAGGSGPPPPAIFAGGDTCSGYGKEQVDISGSNNEIYGGVHSNDNIDVSGSDNDFGDGNPDEDPFTYVDSMTEGGSGNDYDAGYPDQVPSEGWPLTLDLADYDTNGSAMLVADAAGEYYRVNGDIDGSYIESRGDGLYYATGNIKLDKDLDADVTLVAEGEVEVSGSTQVLDPYINGVLIFADQTYSGIDQCDKFAVKMSGSSNAWTGLIYAPKALIEMSGSSNTSVTGSLLGYSVRVNGSDVHIEASGGGSSSYGPLFSLID